MKHKMYLLLLTLLVVGIGHAQSLGQVVMSNSGTTLSGASNTLSFTLGEPVIGNISNGESLGQGFWLGAIEEAVLGAEDFTLETNATVYPNPVKDLLNIRFEDMAGEDFEIALYDIRGTVVMQREFTNSSGTELLNFEAFAAGVYVLKVVQTASGKNKTFKLIKN